MKKFKIRASSYYFGGGAVAIKWSATASELWRRWTFIFCSSFLKVKREFLFLSSNLERERERGVYVMFFSLKTPIYTSLIPLWSCACRSITQLWNSRTRSLDLRSNASRWSCLRYSVFDSILFLCACSFKPSNLRFDGPCLPLFF